MRKIAMLTVLCAFCAVAMAQVKMTPQARLRVAQQKNLQQVVNARQGTPNVAGQDGQTANSVRLVLNIEGGKATFGQLRAAGATVLSRLGRQVVVSVPVESIDALCSIEGVKRIDSGHKGRLKTDVTRRATGVSLLNGPSVEEAVETYSGKGVNLCLFDTGFDFQHPAFKDSEGRSRIKCVYILGDESGRKYTVNDPEAGEYTFPGSVYDTPELLAKLTTDATSQYHGSHTASIAGGSLSPQGFGGMAPDADLVLIAALEEAEGLDGMESTDDLIELVFAFAAHYADQSEQPTVLSASLNSHAGPHDGTSTVTQAIEELSKHLVPVFSAGNEGGYPIHIYKKFTKTSTSIKSVLGAMLEDETGEYALRYLPSVTGYTRAGNSASVQLNVIAINPFTGKVTTVWSSEKCTATLGGENVEIIVNSDDDATLAKKFEGTIYLAGGDNGDGRLCVMAAADGGGSDPFSFMTITVSGEDGTEIDLWDENVGFFGTTTLGLPGYTEGDNEMSAGDWTCTNSVISVGAYCANTTSRAYDGSTVDTSVSEDEEEPADVEGDIAFFSSYGTTPNGVSQPTVCAPGVNIVSAWNHYALAEDAEVADGMQWEGYVYGAESGTSMACPVVSGIVALWLQADPTLTLADVKEVMENASDADDFTSKNTERWGFGKISAKRGIDYILKKHTDGIRSHYTPASDQRSAVIYDLQGRRLQTGQIHKGIYIKNGKKYVTF